MAVVDAVTQQRQILVDSAGSLSVAWFSDGEPADPGVTTVGVVNDAGTTVIASGTATTGTGTAARSVAFTTTHSANLDRLTVTWTSATYGASTAIVEVVGAWLFTIAECRAFDGGAIQQARPIPEATAIEEARVRILDEFEMLTGVAWVPRYRRDIYSGDGLTTLFLPTGRVRAIRSAENRAYGQATWTAVTADELADLYYEPWGLLRRESLGTFLSGSRNWRIGYEHGADQPPLDIKRAALMAARYELIPSNISERAISISNEMGTTNLWTPGLSGRGRAIHPLPEVDRILRAHDERVPVVR